jgi:WD40 repeat protein
VRKALLATCSLDKSVKVWNYLEHTLECSKEFEEGAIALAFHPSGLLMVVAFEDKIRMMNIYEHDLVVIKEIPIKNCKEIKFSNGGHLFAIANQSVV